MKSVSVVLSVLMFAAILVSFAYSEEKSGTTDSQKKTKPKEAESGDKSKGPTKAKPA